jgi:hypothetical protein
MYSWGVLFCSITVPIIEVVASRIKVMMASFREQKKSHSSSVKLFSLLKVFSPGGRGSLFTPLNVRLSHQKQHLASDATETITKLI